MIVGDVVEVAEERVCVTFDAIAEANLDVIAITPKLDAYFGSTEFPRTEVSYGDSQPLSISFLPLRGPLLSVSQNGP